MSTFTNSGFSCYEIGDIFGVGGWFDNGSDQSWVIVNSAPTYIEASSPGTAGNQPQAAVAHYPISVAGVASFVWVRARGGVFRVSYADDPLIETITAANEFAWYKVSTDIVNQSKVRFYSQDAGVDIDKFIITQATETPTGAEGFTNNASGGGNTGGSGGSTGSTTSNNGVCTGTATVGCFFRYELETAFWLEQGTNNARWLVRDGANQGSSGNYLESLLTSPSGSLAESAKAHLSIAQTNTGGWSTWFRVRGNGTFRHIWADDDSINAVITASNVDWHWVKSTLPHNAIAAKIKILSETVAVDVDSVVLIDTDETPTGVSGFCQDVGSGNGGGSGQGVDTNEDYDLSDINSDRHLWLPANLECVITVIPPEPTNR